MAERLQIDPAQYEEGTAPALGLSSDLASYDVFLRETLVFPNQTEASTVLERIADMKCSVTFEDIRASKATTYKDVPPPPPPAPPSKPSPPVRKDTGSICPMTGKPKSPTSLFAPGGDAKFAAALRRVRKQEPLDAEIEQATRKTAQIVDPQTFYRGKFAAEIESLRS